MGMGQESCFSNTWKYLKYERPQLVAKPWRGNQGQNSECDL